MDYSPPSSSVHGILQARILEWVTVLSFRGSSWPSNPICYSYISCIIMQDSSLPLAPLCALSVQFSSIAQSCPTLCDPVNCSTPGLLVHHQLPEFTQTHVHRVGDGIQPSHPLLSPSPPAPNPSQHQSFPRSQRFASGGQSIGVSASASVLPVNTQDWFPLEWTSWISFSPRDSQESSPTPQFKSINSSALSFLHSPTLTSIHVLYST